MRHAVAFDFPCDATRKARLRRKFSIAAALWLCPVAAWAQPAAPGTGQGAAVGTGPAVSTGSAQAYPVKPVRYVVPFGAGASPDIVARLLGDRLTRRWGQQVIVENRVGVAGLMGAAFVAKSPPDGYTLLQCNIASSAISVSLYANAPYDQVRDFIPITRIGTTPNILTAHSSVPIKSIGEFITYAKAHPGKLSYSAGLAGESPQLSMELLKMLVKIDVAHIPYKVAAQGITDTIGGQIPFNISNLPAIVGPVQTGRLRALAVTGAKRAALLPAVPTMQESGVSRYEVNSWYGLCAPANTPAPVVDKLYTDFTAVLRLPDIQQRLDELAIDTTPQTREAFDQFIRSEIARWSKVIKDAGIPQQ
jgi:tripartite-type tricarboxylate transporter receptor subunit TctC